MSTTPADAYLHDSACGLQDDNAQVRDDFIDVIEETLKRTGPGRTTDWGAAGCGSCFHSDADAVIFWVAQGDSVDSMVLKYDVGDDSEMSRSDLGELIVDTAEDLGVAVSWNNDPSTCVFLGVTDRFKHFEPGTRVKSTNRRRQREGVVLDPDLINSKLNYQVWDQTEYDGFGAGGELIARFDDRKDAKRFKRNYSPSRDLKIDRIRKAATREGENVVAWDGQSKPEVVKGSDIVEIDD